MTEPDAATRGAGDAYMVWHGDEATVIDADGSVLVVIDDHDSAERIVDALNRARAAVAAPATEAPITDADERMAELEACLIFADGERRDPTQMEAHARALEIVRLARAVVAAPATVPPEFAAWREAVRASDAAWRALGPTEPTSDERFDAVDAYNEARRTESSALAALRAAALRDGGDRE